MLKAGRNGSTGILPIHCTSQYHFDLMPGVDFFCSKKEERLAKDRERKAR